MSTEVPQTVEQAAECLLIITPKAEQGAFAAIPEARLIENHLGLALWVRNNFGLWTGNDALVADTGALDPDGASAVIVGVLAAASAPHAALGREVGKALGLRPNC